MTAPRLGRRHPDRGRRGHAAIELPVAVALLLVPVVLVVATLPAWSERRHVAVVAAREAAVVAAARWPADGSDAAAAAARAVAETHRVPAGDLLVRTDGTEVRGGTVAVTVTVRMPAISIPGAGTVGAWSWSTSHAVRIDDYRSR